MVCNRNGCSFKAKAWNSKSIGSVCVGSAMTAHIRSVHHGVWSCCDQCKFKSATKCNLVRHTNMKHPSLPRPKVKCTLCETQLLNTKYNINEHMKKMHTDQPSFFCSKCKFSTKYKNSLAQHEKGHQDPYQCENCDFTCTSKQYMNTHKKIKHDGEYHVCTSCDFTGSLGHVKSHEVQHSEPTVKCTVCDYTAKSTSRLKNHMQRHGDPKYFCKECDYKTYDRTNFTSHKIINHGNVILKCENCDYTTKSKRSLKQHIEKQH